MQWLTLLIVIVVVVVLAVVVFRPTTTTRAAIPSLHFSLADFQRDCGEVYLRVELFRDAHNRALLDPVERRDITVREWLTNTSDWVGWASKLKFQRGSQHPVARYLLDWLAARHTLLPLELQQRLVSGEFVEFCLRASSGQWHYPNHYDCVDNYALVLAGQRTVRLNRQEVRKLHAGELLLIPPRQEHEFWCDGPPSEFNLLLNIDFLIPQPERSSCDLDFQRIHPVHVARLQNFHEYT